MTVAARRIDTDVWSRSRSRSRSRFLAWVEA